MTNVKAQSSNEKIQICKILYLDFDIHEPKIVLRPL
jgi:hypothetical protein